MLAAIGLLVLNGLVSRWQRWTFPGTAWWTWLLLAVPEVLLLVVLVVAALGGVSPGRNRSVALVLLGFLAGASLTATGGRTSSCSACSPGSSTRGVLWDASGTAASRPTSSSRSTSSRVSPRLGGAPRLLDYEYVSLTNSLALSPTDAMPLSRRAKSLMGLESLVSNALVVLVIARAVNVLGS
jgi:hypothetical protein